MNTKETNRIKLKMNPPKKLPAYRSGRQATCLPVRQASYKLRGGFTMIEMTVATSLFVIIISLATGAFVQAMKSQSVIVASSTSISNVSQILEQMTRELRTGESFVEIVDGLKFKNYKGETVIYKYEGGVSKLIRRCVSLQTCGPGQGSVITTTGVSINSMKLYYLGKVADSASKRPTQITIAIDVAGFSGRHIVIQTSVSARNPGE